MRVLASAPGRSKSISFGRGPLEDVFSMLQLLLPAAAAVWRHACSVGQWCAVLFIFFFFHYFFFFKKQCDNDFELLFSSSILKDLSISRVLSIVPMSLLQNTRQHPGRRVSILELLASPTIW